MSKGGDGGYDTSAMEAATNRSIDLQEKMYEEGKDLAQPWYNAGSSAVGRLSDLLGLSGGSVKSRESIYSNLLPQYTSNTQSTPAKSAYDANVGPTAEQMTTLRTYRPDIAKGFDDAGSGAHRNPLTSPASAQAYEFFQNYQPQAQSSSSVDYAGLNSAVDAQMGNQERPDDYGTLGKAFSMENYQEDPGYQFRLAEGQKALDRSLAAKGKTFSGEAAKAAVDYNSGMASQEYGNAYNRYNTDQNNLYNMLAGVSGFGQNASNQQIQSGQNMANNVGNLTTGLANAQTSAQVAKASRPSLFGQIAQAAIPAAMMFASDERLKENKRLVETIDGIERWEFTYKDDPEKVRYLGAMAQQVLDVIPESVFVMDDGHYGIDYAHLPFAMEIACH